jgi:hypothetical protein
MSQRLRGSRIKARWREGRAWFAAQVEARYVTCLPYHVTCVYHSTVRETGFFISLKCINAFKQFEDAAEPQDYVCVKAAQVITLHYLMGRNHCCGPHATGTYPSIRLTSSSHSPSWLIMFWKHCEVCLRTPGLPLRYFTLLFHEPPATKAVFTNALRHRCSCAVLWALHNGVSGMIYLLYARSRISSISSR